MRIPASEMNLPRRLWQEVAAALVLLVFAAGAALVWQRPLITAAWRGEVPALLAAKRQERRAEQFHGIPTPDLAETYRLWQERQTLFIDARPASEYEELHVAGAVNLPPEAWDRLASPPLPPDKDHPLLVYCSQESCDDALKLARRLREAGYTRVMAFTGGFREWDEAGYPVDIVR